MSMGLVCVSGCIPWLELSPCVSNAFSKRCFDGPMVVVVSALTVGAGLGWGRTAKFLAPLRKHGGKM